MEPFMLELLARERRDRMLAQAAAERAMRRPRPRQRLGHWLIGVGMRLTGGGPLWAPERQTRSS